MRRPIPLMVGVLAASAAGLGLPGTGVAVTTCTIGVLPADPTPTMSLSHTLGSNTVVLRVVRAAGGGAPVISVTEDGDVVACSGLSAAVDQVAVIRYANSAGTSDLVIEEPGAFGPGVAALNLDGRIKIAVTESDGRLNSVVLRDTDGLAEHDDFSSLPGLYAVDVNPGVANAQLDIGIRNPVFADFVAEGSPQADALTVVGGRMPYARRLTLTGGGGADILTGGEGNDVIDPGPGDDVVDGGGGFDSVDYSASTAGVDVDLARPGPQQGGSLGADTLTRIEDVFGSDHADVLRGDGAGNTLDGGLGDDLIEGRGGNDFMSGDIGTDTLSYQSATASLTVDAALTSPQVTGGAGVDQLFDPFEGLVGGTAADTLRGTSGPDVIDGGPGADTISALGGDDRVLLRDGAPDTADCGEGLDRADVDPGGIDALVACEAVAVGVAPSLLPPGSAGTGGAGGVAGGAHRVAARLAGAKSQRLVRGAVAVSVTCPLLACSVRAGAVATLKSGKGTVRRVTLRAARARLGAGATTTLRLTLPTAGLTKVHTALADGRSPVVRVTVVVTDAAAGRKTLRRAITLRR